MSGRSALSLTVVAALLAGSCRCFGADITKEMRSEDARLNQTVNIASPRLRIGEILDTLSKQTGVPLQMNDRAIGSGVPVLAFVRDRPLADVLNGLASLCGTRGFEWAWARDGEPGRYCYVLRAPDLAKVAQAWRDRCQQAFEDQAALLAKAAVASPEERKKLLDGHNSSDKMILTDDRVLAGNLIFSQALSPAQRQGVLRGQLAVNVPLAKLSPEGLAHVRAEKDTSRRPDIVSRYVRFQTDHFPLEPTPTMFMDIEGIGGLSYIGGVPLANQMRDEIENDWFLPGDEKSDPAAARTVEAPKQRGGDDIGSIADTVLKMAEGSEVSCLAVLPTIPPGNSLPDPVLPFHMPVASALTAMRESQWHMFNKWRGGVLLLNSAAWLLASDSGESYATYKQIRAALAGSGGLDLRLLAAATLGLSPDRLEALRMEFPDLEVAIKYRGGLALLGRYPQVAQSTKPVPITPAMAGILLRASGWPDVSAFRFVRLYKATGKGSHQTEVRFELYDRSANPLVMMSTKIAGH